MTYGHWPITCWRYIGRRVYDECPVFLEPLRLPRAVAGEWRKSSLGHEILFTRAADTSPWRRAPCGRRDATPVVAIIAGIVKHFSTNGCRPLARTQTPACPVMVSSADVTAAWSAMISAGLPRNCVPDRPRCSKSSSSQPVRIASHHPPFTNWDIKKHSILHR